jgi:cyclopropane fatty-acyl-phospholipid synthase-like methyltransferase
MMNARLYGHWGALTDGLRTGEPQNEIKRGGHDLFSALYSDERRLEQFLRAMQGAQLGNFMTLVEKVDFSKQKTFCDVGGANGTLAALVAAKHAHLTCRTFDLPVVAPVAKRNLQAMGLADRVEVLTGNFFTDPLPKSDIITMGNILHDWNEAQKVELLTKAHAALEPGGRFIAIEMVIDDARRKNTMGLLMSLNMMVETTGGFDYTGAQFDAWCKKAGFARTEIVHLLGPASAAIAYR